MGQLNAKTRLPPSVIHPSYDRSSLKPGIVHIGFGAFHRAHQAIFTQRALSAEFAPWGIVALNLRSAAPLLDLQAQDGLYAINVRGSDRDKLEVVGATVAWVCAAQDRPQALACLARDEIKIVTLTVSEKAYGLHPITAGLDEHHPAVAADLANPRAPTGVLGVLVESLFLRRQAGLAPYTVLCCDNLPANGKLVRRLVLEMAARRDPDLARWIAEEGAFPCSMVDRIVPAATAETRDRAEAILGVCDHLAVETEPFVQWVIEDRFVSGRPRWEAGGAIFVEDVAPYEKMKLRMLNGAHSLLAHLGLLNGLECIRDVMAAPAAMAWAQRHLDAAIETLPPVPGVDLGVYRAQLMARFANPALAHKCQQIAADTSQKLPQRFFEPAVESLARGKTADAFADGVGIWIAALRKLGACEDPRREELLAATATMDPKDPSASFFALKDLFPPSLLAARKWRDRVNAAITAPCFDR